MAANDVIALDEVVVDKPKPVASTATATANSAATNLTAVIYANGKKFTGWESFQIKRTFGDGISSFAFTPAEGSFGQGYALFTIQPGDAVSIELAGKLAFTGWCDGRNGSFDAQSHQLVITGMSKTVDLARSSVPVRPGTFDGSTFEQVARAVLDPHGIALRIVNPLAIAAKAIANLSVQPGETVAELLARIAPMRGFHLTDDASGNLVASQGNPKAAPIAQLAEGRNIKSATWKFRDPSACRWTKFAAISQTVGSDGNWPTNDISATARTTGVRPGTNRIIVSEHPGDAEDLAQVVNHAASAAIWPETNLTVQVVGWVAPDGQLWSPEAPRQNVSVYSPMAFGDTGVRTFGIQSVTFSQDEHAGSITTLELVRPDAQTSSPTAGVAATPGVTTSPAVPDAPDTQAGG